MVELVSWWSSPLTSEAPHTPWFFPVQRKGGATPHTLPTAKAQLQPGSFSLFLPAETHVSYFKATKRYFMAASESKFSTSFEEATTTFLLIFC